MITTASTCYFTMPSWARPDYSDLERENELLKKQVKQLQSEIFRLRRMGKR
jgi:hypothetical protein